MPINWTTIYKKYAGKWVALADDEKTVLANGSSAKTALDKARQKGFADPILMRVPTKVITYVG